MKITNIRVLQPLEPECPDDWRSWLGQIAVFVDTDDGITGFGVGGGGPAGIRVVETVLRQRLIGEKADDPEALHEMMIRTVLPFGRKGLAIMAVSGVDLALWDLRGKRTGKPVAELLGGHPSGERIPLYRTNPDDPKALIEEGWRGVKLSFPAGTEQADILSSVQRTRETMGGRGELMIDMAGDRDREAAVRLAEALVPYDLAWIENPIRIDRLDAALARPLRQPV